MTLDPTNIKAVLFDFDDTLAETLPGRQSAVQYAFVAAGVDSPTADEFLKTVNGRTFNQGFMDISNSYGRDLDLLNLYRERYWTAEADNSPLFEGVREAVLSIHSHGFKLALVTSKIRSFNFQGRALGAQYQMEISGINHLFDILVGGEDVKLHKPDPESIKLAVRKLGITADEALMIGDSTADIGAANAAGCWSCHAVWAGTPPGPPLEGIRPDFVAEKPSQVLQILGIVD